MNELGFRPHLRFRSKRVLEWVVALLTMLPASTPAGSCLLQQRQADPGELARIIETLDIDPGDAVADVGAGLGSWTVELARRVGKEGHVFSTEVDAERLKDIRDRVTEAELENVSVVWGSQKDTGLPPHCCDAILLRRVYHHFTHPVAMQASLLRALRPGGLLAVIDFDSGTRKGWREPEGVPRSRGGHGIPKSLLIQEMASAGFEAARELDRWGDGHYCVVFQRAP
ncbi:MAG: class I SAM-dependent methyltransferase [Acidobacteriota bacterium]